MNAGRGEGEVLFTEVMLWEIELDHKFPSIAEVKKP
jgi:hypothetical protein